jgi:hypothetical protein
MSHMDILPYILYYISYNSMLIYYHHEYLFIAYDKHKKNWMKIHSYYWAFNSYQFFIKSI